jgi:VanZ family protein
MPIPEQVPLKDVPMMDKWTHFVMYGTLCLTIWIEYLKRHKKTNKKRIFLFAIIAPILMSGIIELAQAYCTGGRRSGELLDFAANSIGVGLGNAIGILLGWFRAKV